MEIEKLTRIYLENYIEKDKPLSFDTLLFHRSMFINNVYKDTLIHSFIEYLVEYFKQKTFYWNHYPKAVEKISEIFENLEFNFNFEDDNESAKEECADGEGVSVSSSVFKGHVMETIGEASSDALNAKKSKKNKKKKKKAKKTAENEPPKIPVNTKESDELESLYTLFCARVDKANQQYASFAKSAKKPIVVFDSSTCERFDKLIVC